MLRLPLTLLSPRGARGRLSTLIYHRVLAQPDPLFPDLPYAAQFEAQMRWVRGWFNVLPLAQAVDRLAAGALPARALAITFDDGYADNEELAAPILKRLGLSATFFVTSGVLGGGRMWNDTVIAAIRGCAREALDLRALGLGELSLRDDARRRQAIDRLLAAIKRLPYAERRARVDAIADLAGGAVLTTDLMMTPAQVRELSALGMDIGAHTVTHPILSRLDDRAAATEIARSRDELQQITGREVPLFAYPNGVPGVDYDRRHVRMVRDLGFSAAFSTAAGVATAGTDLFQLPRFTPWDRSQLRYGLRLAQNLVRVHPELA